MVAIMRLFPRQTFAFVDDFSFLINEREERGVYKFLARGGGHICCTHALSYHNEAFPSPAKCPFGRFFFSHNEGRGAFTGFLARGGGEP